MPVKVTGVEPVISANAALSFVKAKVPEFQVVVCALASTRIETIKNKSSKLFSLLLIIKSFIFLMIMGD